jgi:acetyl-CoA carboxylase biotin carboxylase subunit
MKRVLVANRGEIALRIIRACHEQDVEAVAVYSEADRLTPHVKAADAAVELGPAPASESYLSVERLLEAARRTGADAVHPGYGFLAEQARFAEAVEQAGLAFVGPPASAIRAMGEKTEARRRMAKAGVPIVPGTTEPLADGDAVLRAAEEIGYPVLLKAAAGGGGKGMRVAATPEEARKGFAAASSEAKSAFGDDAIYLEKFVERPRHVEIQVLADRFGNTIHLGERECSVQRRHQKLIEESPSPAVDLDLRLRMGEAAVKAAQAVGYLSAGTVEFLLDTEGKFYFPQSAHAPARSRHRVPSHGGRSLRQFPAGHRPDRLPARALRSGRAVGRWRRDGERGRAVLRLAAGEADRLGGEPRTRGPAHAACARRARHRGSADVAAVPSARDGRGHLPEWRV